MFTEELSLIVEVSDTGILLSKKGPGVPKTSITLFDFFHLVFGDVLMVHEDTTGIMFTHINTNQQFSIDTSWFHDVNINAYEIGTRLHAVCDEIKTWLATTESNFKTKQTSTATFPFPKIGG